MAEKFEKYPEQSPWQIHIQQEFYSSMDAVFSVLPRQNLIKYLEGVTVTYDLEKNERTIEFPHNTHGIEQLTHLTGFINQAIAEQKTILKQHNRKELGLWGEAALKYRVNRLIAESQNKKA